jgi:hypothetical protein
VLVASTSFFTSALLRAQAEKDRIEDAGAQAGRRGELDS